MKQRQRGSGTAGVNKDKRGKAHLEVELLEDRCLLAAGLSSPLATIALTPNDPSFSSQYALLGSTGTTAGPGINAQAAWNVTTGNLSTVVGVIDTGIDYNHPDLYQNVWLNQAEIPLSRLRNLVDVDHDGIISFRDLNNPINQGAGKITDVNHDGRIDASDILAPMILDASGHDTGLGGWAYAGNTRDGDTAHPNDFIGWNFVANTNNPFDDNGHGTHVSGIIGAQGNNGVGISGVDWNVQLMGLKVFDASGSGPVSNAVAALNYAVQHGAALTNNSWSMSTATYQPLYDAIVNAQAHGQIYVAAAGNFATNTDVTPEYPASYALSNVVSVAASNTESTLAPYSDFGSHSVSIAAPGQNILSTWPGGGYQILSGTSMAAPQVTGVLALVRGLHPTWSATQVINQVLSTADHLPTLAGKTESGLVDAAKAVGAGTQPPPPVQPGTPAVGPHVVSFTPSATGAKPVSSVRVTFSAAINPSTFTAAGVTLTGPHGAVAIQGIQAVAGSGNTQFDILFVTQRTAGVYTLTILPKVRDTQGNLMDQDQDGPAGSPARDGFSGTFAINPVYSFTGNGPLAFKGGSTTTSKVTINQDVTITKLTVTVLLSYPHMSDLVIRLIGPDGTVVFLSNHDGGSGNNLVSAVFDDAATLTLNTAPAPFGGTYRPDNPLSVFNGKDARGTWQVSVFDLAPGSSGMFHFFTLTIQGSTGTGGTSSFEGGETVDSGTPVVASLPALPAGIPSGPAAQSVTTAIPAAPAEHGTAVEFFAGLFSPVQSPQPAAGEEVQRLPAQGQSFAVSAAVRGGDSQSLRQAADLVFASGGSEGAGTDLFAGENPSAAQLMAYFGKAPV